MAIEIDERVLKGVGEKEDRCLVGKILTERKVGQGVIGATMGKVWRVSKPAVFQEVRANVFVISFATKEDRQRVWAGKPWLFDNCLIVLNLFDGFTKPANMCFEKELFWIQLHDLPLACMNDRFGKMVGGTVGEVVEIDVKEDGCSWGEFLRVKVEVDLTKPITRGRTVNVKGKELWIPIKYEKMPRICFECGKFFHSNLECVGKGGRKKLQGAGEGQFGIWLRAGLNQKRFGVDGYRGFEASGTKGSYDAAKMDRKVSDEVSVTSEGKEKKKKETEGDVDAGKEVTGAVSTSLVAIGVDVVEGGGERSMIEGLKGEMMVKIKEGQGKTDTRQNGEGLLVEVEVQESIEALCGEVIGSEQNHVVGMTGGKNEGKKEKSIGEGKWKRRARGKGIESGFKIGKIQGKRPVDDVIQMGQEGKEGKKVRRKENLENEATVEAEAAVQPCQTQ